VTPNSRNLEFCVVIGEGGPSPGPSAEVESLARGGGRAAHATGRGRPELLNRIQSRGKPQRRRRKASGAIERVHCNKHRAETTANGSVNRPSALWSLAYGITTFFWGARRRPAAGVKWYFFFFLSFPFQLGRSWKLESLNRRNALHRPTLAKVTLERRSSRRPLGLANDGSTSASNREGNSPLGLAVYTR